VIALIRPAAKLNRYIQNVPLNYVALAAFLSVVNLARKLTNSRNAVKLFRAVARRIGRQETVSVN
jgi:hypothetical protein